MTRASFALLALTGCTAALAASLPTGATDLTADGREGDESLLQDYGMQPGSGTWDLHPSITYMGEAAAWLWGAQLSGVHRLGTNRQGYALGDQFHATGWIGYRPVPALTATLRGAYADIGDVEGGFDSPSTRGSPADYPSNYGGQYWDLGIGLRWDVRDGAYAGNSFGAEWVQPVGTRHNGFQLERGGALHASWSYAF